MAALPPAPPAPPAPDRTRLPLLTLITQQSLDEDYLVAAERRAAGGPLPRGHARRTSAALAVVILFGLMVATAALQTQRNAPLADQSRESLIDRINAQKAVLAKSQQKQAKIADHNTSGQRKLTRLTTAGAALTDQNEQVAAQAGFGPVTGPGIRVTVTQVPDADQNQMVIDSDLALLANGLWAAGAEAISINGQRLTERSAIRSSGPAIYVDEAGLAPPYVVSVIGDQRTLEARFYDTATGLDFATRAQDYGFSFSVDNVSTMTLPAAPTKLRNLTSAAPARDQGDRHLGGRGDVGGGGTGR